MTETARRAILSMKQARLLAFIEIGFDDAEIAEALGISPSAVRSSIRAAYRRIGVQTRAEAAAWVADALLNGDFPRTALHGDADACAAILRPRARPGGRLVLGALDP